MDTSGITIGGSPVAVGDRVVYPNGGICRVKGLESKQIAGQSWNMLMLAREEDGATVMVPQSKVGSIGLRKVATAEAIEVLFQFFTHSSSDPELDWKVRHRENFEKMAAGGLLDTAGVLKGLHALAQIRPLPQKEREMYDSARHQLIGEISAALNVPQAVAENNIDYALTPPPGSGRTAPKDAPLDLKQLRRSLGGKRTGLGAALDDEEEETEDVTLGLDAPETDAEKDEDKDEAAGEGEVDGEDTGAKAPAIAAKPVAKAPKPPKPLKPPKAKPAAPVEAPPPAPVEVSPAAREEPPAPVAPPPPKVAPPPPPEVIAVAPPLPPVVEASPLPPAKPVVHPEAVAEAPRAAAPVIPAPPTPPAAARPVAAKPAPVKAVPAKVATKPPAPKEKTKPTKAASKASKSVKAAKPPAKKAPAKPAKKGKGSHK
jgi:RNA polymerase-interacting CarD/CdnL/TRCF family regulator